MLSGDQPPVCCLHVVYIHNHHPLKANSNFCQNHIDIFLCNMCLAARMMSVQPSLFQNRSVTLGMISSIHRMRLWRKESLTGQRCAPDHTEQRLIYPNAFSSKPNLRSSYRLQIIYMTIHPTIPRHGFGVLVRVSSSVFIFFSSPFCL